MMTGNARLLSSARGFTLVEVLVAVLVFSLLVATAYGGLNALVRAVDAERERSAALADAQRLVATLDADIRQLASRAGRDREGRALPAFAAGPDGWLGRRAGRANPADLPRSELQQVRWRYADGRLLRETWSMLDQPPSLPPVGTTGYPLAAPPVFRYRDRTGAWHRQWPVDGRLTALPSAVEYVVEIVPYGPIRRVIAL